MNGDALIEIEKAYREIKAERLNKILAYFLRAYKKANPGAKEILISQIKEDILDLFIPKL